MKWTRKFVVAGLAVATVASVVAANRIADAAVATQADISVSVSTLVLGRPNGSGDRVGVIQFTVTNDSDVSLFNVRVDFNLSSDLRLDAAGTTNCVDGNVCFVFPPQPRASETFAFTVRRSVTFDDEPPLLQSLDVTGFVNPGEKIVEPVGDRDNFALFSVQVL